MNYERPKRPETWAKMCLSKARFTSYSRAEKTAKKYGQRVYWCPMCTNYHCTKQPELAA